LIVFNYGKSRSIALLGADEQFERIGTQVRSSVAALYGPAQNLVDVSSKALPADDLSNEQRLRSMSYFTEALRVNSGITSIFVGYANGDFLLVRHAKQRHFGREDVDAPPETSFVVQSIERDASSSAVYEMFFLDDALRRLERRKLEWTGFDPRQREWFQGANAVSEQFVTGFYAFFTTGELGVTIARRLESGGGVVGVDLSLRDLNAGLAQQRVTESTRVAMLEPDGTVIALADKTRMPELISDEGGGKVQMPHLSELSDPIYRRLAEALTEESRPSRLEFEVDGETWLASLSFLPVRAGSEILLTSVVPRSELLVGVARVRDQSVMISAGLLLLALIVVVAISRHLSRSLHRLAREAQQIRELRLDTPLTVRSSIEEVDELAQTMAEMKSSLQQFLALSRALSAEKEFDRLLERVLDEACRVSGAEAGAILLESEDSQRLEVAILRGPSAGTGEERRGDDTLEFDPVELGPEDAARRRSIDWRTARDGVAIRIDLEHDGTGFDLRDLTTRFQAGGSVPETVLSVPLRTQQDDVIGVLQLVNARGPGGSVGPFRDETVPYIEALSSNAAVALDNRRLLKAQKDLLESFIHVVAGAIDAKSHYTHGHCRRVPEVARMLAEAVHDCDEGTYAKFELSSDEWYELHLASWLHDCGKVTTPEYVVDKATKLETIYNRIHEIRMRFEVLWRDAHVEYLEALSAGATGDSELRMKLLERQAEIREDFEFVAECNRGGEFMSDESIERLHRIAAQSWQRNLDDRLGLSQEEQKRRSGQPAPDLPVSEPLLADRPEHIVPRVEEDARKYVDDPYGFRVEVPEHMYDRGELHNLTIRRGTLSVEERFKINEHIVETIRMLARLPFPRELRRVPDWAGNHHEKLDGTGYPRRLKAEQLSVPDRIMAIADIFEALTATDRPYMQPKTLSQAIRIMHSMCEEGHICRDMFGLFLSSGVHLRYAREFLQPRQIDEVDVQAILR
jgi:HD-GYP domain-containing protein (c-di-GMP phosphodiesterase class II)